MELKSLLGRTYHTELDRSFQNRQSLLMCWLHTPTSCHAFLFSQKALLTESWLQVHFPEVWPWDLGWAQQILTPRQTLCWVAAVSTEKPSAQLILLVIYSKREEQI